MSRAVGVVCGGVWVGRDTTKKPTKMGWKGAFRWHIDEKSCESIRSFDLFDFQAEIPDEPVATEAEPASAPVAETSTPAAAPAEDEDTLDKRLAHEIKEAQRQQVAQQNADRTALNKTIESSIVSFDRAGCFILVFVLGRLERVGCWRGLLFSGRRKRIFGAKNKSEIANILPA